MTYSEIFTIGNAECLVMKKIDPYYHNMNLSIFVPVTMKKASMGELVWSLRSLFWRIPSRMQLFLNQKCKSRIFKLHNHFHLFFNAQIKVTRILGWLTLDISISKKFLLELLKSGRKFEINWIIILVHNNYCDGGVEVVAPCYSDFVWAEISWAELKSFRAGAF